MQGVRYHRDIQVAITADEVWRCLGAGQRSRGSLEMEVKASAAEATRLCSPAAVSLAIKSTGAGKGTVTFGGGTRIQGRLLPHLLEGAEGAVFLIVTAGAGIERRVQEMFAADDDLTAFVLDAAGSAAAMAAFAFVASRIGAELATAGQRIGPCLKPGTDAWSIEGQRDIFALLPAAEIGVTLQDSLLMTPQKTQSGIIAFGRSLKITDDPHTAPCVRCSAGRCPMRIEPYGGAPPGTAV